MDTNPDSHPTRYLVVGLPRSGTTVVHLAIRGHPQVAAFSDEIHVNPLFDQATRVFSFGHETDAEAQQGALALFDALAALGRDEQTTHLGMKVCAQTPRQAELLVDGLHRHFPEIKVVLTIRRDLVATYASSHSARSTGSWHSWNRPATPDGPPPQRPLPFLFRRHALRSMTILKILAKLHETHDVFDFEYERLLDPAHDMYTQVFDFLGLPEMPVTWLAAKKVMPPPEQFILNYARLVGIQQQLQQQIDAGSVSPWLRWPVALLDRATTWRNGCEPGSDRQLYR